MPENTTVQPAAFEPFVVNRNNVDVTFVPRTVSRGDNKGNQYPAVEVTKDNLSLVESWLGVDVRMSLIQAKLNQRCQSWYGEATVEADGETAKPFDIDEFKKFAAEFNARGESLSEIKKEIEELTAEMVSIDWSLGAAAAAKAEELGKQIKSLIIARESKRRVREATPAAPVQA